jgi:predicted phosphoribosyltransferase
MHGHPAPYRDRTHAGEVLAESLVAWQDASPLVIGIPRGGVVVAQAVAAVLGADLDAVIVRKIGAPAQPELAIGAVAPTGQVILDHPLIERMRIDELALRGLITEQQQEARRRLLAYRGSRPPLDVHERVAIVVDDGLATGATMAIALRVLRLQHPLRLIAAAPVSSRPALESLRPMADAVVCPLAPVDLMAVGAYYDNFNETTDGEVRAILAETIQRTRER